MNETRHGRRGEYWDDQKLDGVTIQVLQKELGRLRKAREERKKDSGYKDTVEESPITVNFESVREALESETGLITSLLPIDRSIGRVAAFDENGKIIGLNPEVLEKLSKLQGPQKLEK